MLKILGCEHTLVTLTVVMLSIFCNLCGSSRNTLKSIPPCQKLVWMLEQDDLVVLIVIININKRSTTA